MGWALDGHWISRTSAPATCCACLLICDLSTFCATLLSLISPQGISWKLTLVDSCVVVLKRLGCSAKSTKRLDRGRSRHSSPGQTSNHPASNGGFLYLQARHRLGLPLNLEMRWPCNSKDASYLCRMSDLSVTA